MARTVGETSAPSLPSQDFVEGERISILMVAGELWPWRRDGVANVVFQLARSVAATGSVKVAVLGTVRGNSATRGSSEWGNGIDLLPVTMPPGPDISAYLYLQVAYILRFSQWIRDVRGPCVVHMHILPALRAFGLAFVARMAHVPLLLSLHGWPPFEMPFLHPRWKHALNWAIARRMLPRIHDTVVNSLLIRDAALERLPRSRIRVIPNAPDHDVWSPRNVGPASGLHDDPLRFIFWGELYQHKGPDLLLRAFRAYLNATSRDGDILHVVGQGRDAAMLQALAKDLDLTRNVTFSPPPPSVPELVKLVESCDVVVLPSDHEGFGLTVFEASALGKPVVSTARGGPREFLRDGVDIIIVERTVGGISEAMANLAANCRLRAQIGMSARRRALEFTWPTVAEQYLEVYEQIARRGVEFVERATTRGEP